jgi:ribosomal protein S18 acetylase RimI-like enzyme
LPKNFKIHKASGVDAGPISVFGRKAFIDAYGDANPPEHVAKYAEQSFDRDVVEAELGEPGFIFLLASSNDNILGYAKLCADRPIDCVSDLHPMQLERVYVDKSQQGAGIGADLIDACVATASECAYRTIWLAAWEENVRAHRFYERHDFHIVGKTYFMLGPERQEDLVMQRSIE